VSRWLDGELKNCGLIHGTGLQKTVTHVVRHFSLRQMPVFNPRPHHVVLLVEKVALGWGFL
jgi:hypothetical protein